MCTLQLIDSPAMKNRNLQRLKCMQNNGYDRAYMAIFNWLFLSFFPLIAFCVVKNIMTFYFNDTRIDKAGCLFNRLCHFVSPCFNKEIPV